MYYSDLGPCDYFGHWGEILVAIGWLDRDRPFARGPVPKPFFEALVRLLVDPWQPAVAAGHAPCPFCRFTGGPAEVRLVGLVAPLGSNNVFVPSDKVVYVAPSLVAHYVDSHEYAPPQVFQEAVLRCPAMKSIAYLRQIDARRFKVPPTCGGSGIFPR